MGKVNGFPLSLAHVFDKAEEPVRSLVPLLIFPERKTALDTEKAPSETDVWVLASHAFGLASVAVEGKVQESFSQTLNGWLATESPGKQTRLEFLAQTLNLTKPISGTIRYQLLHRLTSAVIEAKQFHANVAVCAVQSFGVDNKGLADFQAFTKLFGATGQEDVGEVISLGRYEGIARYAVWVNDPS